MPLVLKKADSDLDLAYKAETLLLADSERKLLAVLWPGKY